MSINWPNSLVHALARRRVVVLIGSGVSANSQDANGMHPPTWGLFLKQAYKDVGKTVPHIAKAIRNFQYLEACEYIKEELGARWAEVIGESFSTPNFKPAEIHKSIFDLDARIVASLNFDRIYDNYAIRASESSVVVKNYFDDDIRQVLTGTGRYIVKPHGSVDTVTKMIFTIDEYGKARIKYATFYNIITALLHTDTFLCIGCGLSDPDMKLVFEDYRYTYSEVPHFMVLPRPIAAAECKMIERTRGMNVLSYSSKNQHAELTTSLAELSKLVEPARADLAQSQNW